MDNSWIHLLHRIILGGCLLIFGMISFTNCNLRFFQIPVIDGRLRPSVFHFLYSAIFILVLIVVVGTCVAMDVMLLLGVD